MYKNNDYQKTNKKPIRIYQYKCASALVLSTVFANILIKFLNDRRYLIIILKITYNHIII